MHFRKDRQDDLFRQEVRDFLGEELTPDIARRTRWHYTTSNASSREKLLRWQRILFHKGWGAPGCGWPVEHGGSGWTGPQRMIYDYEIAAANAPIVHPQSLSMVGPAIIGFGTAAQKARFLPPILRGEVLWCQGFSEPGAGSDLASLRTSAVREGDVWRVNGQKIWTTHANIADWAFLLARTDPNVKKQLGISFFLVDMKSPGISVQPIVTIDGEHHVNTVFFDNVIVPNENLLGSPGQGWEITKSILSAERMFAVTNLPELYRVLAQAHEITTATLENGERLIKEEAFFRRLARLEIEMACLEMKLLETVSQTQSEADEAVIGSVLKVRATELYQALVQFVIDALGDAGAVAFPDPEGHTPAAVPPAPAYAIGAASTFFYNRGATIWGGANEIQRSIIAKAWLGN